MAAEQRTNSGGLTSLLNSLGVIWAFNNERKEEAATSSGALKNLMAAAKDVWPGNVSHFHWSGAPSVFELTLRGQLKPALIEPTHAESMKLLSLKGRPEFSEQIFRSLQADLNRAARAAGIILPAAGTALQP